MCEASSVNTNMSLMSPVPERAFPLSACFTAGDANFNVGASRAFQSVAGSDVKKYRQILGAPRCGDNHPVLKVMRGRVTTGALGSPSTSRLKWTVPGDGDGGMVRHTVPQMADRKMELRSLLKVPTSRDRVRPGCAVLCPDYGKPRGPWDFSVLPFAEIFFNLDIILAMRQHLPALFSGLKQPCSSTWGWPGVSVMGSRAALISPRAERQVPAVTVPSPCIRGESLSRCVTGTPNTRTSVPNIWQAVAVAGGDLMGTWLVRAKKIVSTLRPLRASGCVPANFPAGKTQNNGSMQRAIRSQRSVGGWKTAEAMRIGRLSEPQCSAHGAGELIAAPRQPGNIPPRRCPEPRGRERHTTFTHLRGAMPHRPTLRHPVDHGEMRVQILLGHQ